MSDKRKPYTKNFNSERIIATNGEVKFVLSKDTSKSEYKVHSVDLNQLAEEGSLQDYIVIRYNKIILELYANGDINVFVR